MSSHNPKSSDDLQTLEAQVKHLTEANASLVAELTQLKEDLKSAGKRAGKKIDKDQLESIKNEMASILSSGESHSTKIDQILEELGITS